MRFHRRKKSKTRVKVIDGKVRSTDRNLLSVWNGLVLDKESPMPGYKHVVSKKDIWSFINIIPNWEKYSFGLERIFLARGFEDTDGMYHYGFQEGTGAICLGAWPEDLWIYIDKIHLEEHKRIFEIIDLHYSKDEEDENLYQARFDEKKAKAYILLHIFLHELGHHYDRMTTKQKKYCKRGEEYAEKFANEIAEIIYPKYYEEFGKP